GGQAAQDAGRGARCAARLLGQGPGHRRSRSLLRQGHGIAEKLGQARGQIPVRVRGRPEESLRSLLPGLIQERAVAMGGGQPGEADDRPSRRVSVQRVATYTLGLGVLIVMVAVYWSLHTYGSA